MVGVFVTREFCDKQKKNYITKDVFNMKVKEYDSLVMEIKEELKLMNKKLDNHITHIAEDIGIIKGLLQFSKKQDNKFEEKVVFKLIGLMTGILVIIQVFLTFFLR